jgi:hypothetical protein
MEDKDKLGWDILHILEKDREDRRAHPDIWFAEIADDLWRTMPDDEAVDDFRFRLSNVPWWASDVVECLEFVLRERPDWAIPTLIEASQRGEWLGSLPEKTDAYFDWLAAQTAPMRTALDAAKQQ